MNKPFLTARWQHLALVTYAVSAELLDEALTDDIEPDGRDDLPSCSAGGATAYVSLVAFDFLDTRVLGVKWPGFVNFPEVNLRAYVREKDGEQRRGVTFIRELVPSRWVAWVARNTYNEPYAAATMGSDVREDGQTLHVEHQWTYGGQQHQLTLETDNQPQATASDSVENFFKEHRWGFGRDRRGRTLTYEVRHPVWRAYDVKRCEVDVDFAALYGPRWQMLNEIKPFHVMLAEGSQVAVYPKG